MNLNNKKEEKQKKHVNKDGKVLYNLLKNAVYGRTMENLRNWNDLRRISNDKDHVKWTSKPSYMSQKIFGNDLVMIRESKVTSTLNKPACVGVC